MAKQTRAATVATGAVIERSLIQRWITRQLKLFSSTDYRMACIELRKWLKAQPARTKKPGGIGR